MSDTQQPAFDKIHPPPSNQRLWEIMANGKEYRIPRFQRSYSWGRSHWEDLWADIRHMREHKARHFMGFLLFQTEDGKAFEVVDGQQRLTTLSLIVTAALGRLQALAEAGVAADQNRRRIQLYENNYLGVANPRTLMVAPKLILNRENDRHFRMLVQRRAVIPLSVITASNRKMDSAFEFFAACFQACDNGERIAEIIDDIAEGLLFTTINVRDDLNAYTVFETINARGMELAAPDLLKNWLFSTMDASESYWPHELDDLEQTWDAIVTQLQGGGFIEFLRAHRAMRRPVAPANRLFRALKSDLALARGRPAAEKISALIDDLHIHAPLYNALQDPQNDFWNRHGGVYHHARAQLQTLKLFGIKNPFSLLMAAFGKLAAADFVKLLRRIVTVAIRYNIVCGKSPAAQENIYNGMANALMQDGASLRDLTDMLAPLYPRREFVAAFAQMSLPARRMPKRALLLLRRIEQHLSGDEPPLLLSIEHVLPYHADDAWQQSFGRTSCAAAVDRLGNFALLPAEQNLAQESFATKREALRASPYHINRHIAAYPEWDMEMLADHQKWLATQANAVWKIARLQRD